MNEQPPEKKLQKAEKEIEDLRNALDQSAIVAFTDEKGNITYVNDRFCEISQYRRDELLGNNHRLINSGYHPKPFFIQLWKTIASGRVWKGEIKNRAKDGSEYWVLTTIVPFMTPEGKPFQFVAIRTDITALKKIQEEAERQRAALMQSEKMASVGELAAGIAHELGNPLAAIAGRMEFLEMQIRSGRVTQDEIIRTTVTVRELADRMASIIRGMKALSRDGAHDPFQRVSIIRVIRDVLDLSTELFERHGIRVEFNPGDAALTVHGQETQLGQVVVNLINNAKDAIRTLSEKWIRIECKERETSVEVSVTDSGPGIPKEIRDKIMLPFFTTKPMGEGSGLGLSVSMSIIRSHGGDFSIDAKSPHTRFVITLPKSPPPKTSPEED